MKRRENSPIDHQLHVPAILVDGTDLYTVWIFLPVKENEELSELKVLQLVGVVGSK